MYLGEAGKQITGFCNRAVFGLLQHNTKMFHGNQEAFVDFFARFQQAGPGQWSSAVGYLQEKTLFGFPPLGLASFLFGLKAVSAYLMFAQNGQEEPFRRCVALFEGNKERFDACGSAAPEEARFAAACAFCAWAIEQGKGFGEMQENPWDQASFCKHLISDLSCERAGGEIAALAEKLSCAEAASEGRAPSALLRKGI